MARKGAAGSILVHFGRGLSRAFDHKGNRIICAAAFALLFLAAESEKLDPWHLAILALPLIALFRRSAFILLIITTALLAGWLAFTSGVFLTLCSRWVALLVIASTLVLAMVRPRQQFGLAEATAWAGMLLTLLLWTLGSMDDRPAWTCWAAAAGFVAIVAAGARLGKGSLPRWALWITGLAIALLIGSRIWEKSEPIERAGFKWIPMPLKQATFAVPLPNNLFLVAPHIDDSFAYVIRADGEIVSTRHSSHESSSTFAWIERKGSDAVLLGLGPELLRFDPATLKYEPLLTFNETDAQGYLHLDSANSRLIETFDTGDCRVIDTSTWQVTGAIAGAQEGMVRMTYDITPLHGTADLLRIDWHFLLYAELTRWNADTGEIKTKRGLFPAAGFINVDLVGDPPRLIAVLTVPGKILVLDPNTLESAREIDVAMGIRKGTWDQARGLYYTINYFTGELYAIDLDRGEVAARAETGLRRCRFPAIDREGRRLALANHFRLLVVDLDLWLEELP